MIVELRFADLEAQPFEEVKSQICAAVRQLDEAVGRPPFPNPSTSQCRQLARSLICMLRYTHQKGCIAALADCSEANMTFPVLCASLKTGSQGGKPCVVLMELFLEALVYMHSVSLYPLQSTIKDAKEVLPKSPVTFKLFVLAGFIDVDNMCFFLGIKLSAEVDTNGRNTAKGKKSLTTATVKGKKETRKETAVVINEKALKMVNMDILNVALELVLPADCVKVLLSLFDTHGKFRQIVGSNSQLAAKIISVYGDHILPQLCPLSLLRCLDVSLLDSFVRLVQMQGEGITLVTESSFTQIPLEEWSCERLTALIRRCSKRTVRQEEAFASLLVYVFFYKLLALWDKSSLASFFVEEKEEEEEAKLWDALLRVAQMLPFSTLGLLPSNDEERFLKPLGVLVESVMRRHTVNTVAATACKIPHESVIAVLEMLTASLDAKLNALSHSAERSRAEERTVGTGHGGHSGKKKTKAGKRNASKQDQLANASIRTELMDQYCKWIVDLICFIFCLVPLDSVKLPDTCSPWRVVEAVAALFLYFTDGGTWGVLHVSSWECFLNLFITVATLHLEHVEVSKMGQKTTAALLTAVSITCRVECCGIIAQKMPEACAPGRWPLSAYKVILDAWLRKKTCVNGFYAPVVQLSSTESVGVVLGLLDDDRLYELAQLMRNTERTAVALLSALEEMPLQNPIEDANSNNGTSQGKPLGVALDGLMRLRQALVKSVENQLKITAERKQKEEEVKNKKLMDEVQQAEELMKKAIAFKKDAERRQDAKNEELMLIQQLREQRQREKEQRLAQERERLQERKKMAAMALREIATVTKAERLAEQRERLLRYRVRVAALFRTSSFFESLGLSSSKIMRLLCSLRPRLDKMTPDDLLEYVVTGNYNVPSDMRAADNDCSVKGLSTNVLEVAEQEGGSGGEGLSFWDSVMQIIAQQSGEAARECDENTAEELSNDVPNSFAPAAAAATTSTGGGGGDDSPSFHRRISAVLNLFDFSIGANDTLPDEMPSLSLRAASRLLDAKNRLAGTGFSNVVEALMACQQHGLCVLHGDVCSLTPLGFRYHYPFHDPCQTLVVQLECRRRKVKNMLAEQQKSDVCCAGRCAGEQEEEEEEVQVSDADSSLTSNSGVVFFSDELF